jgi:hypothetical protein
MFGNTLTLPHADGNIVCNKINQDQYSSEYMFRNTTHEVRVKIRHTTTKASTTRPKYDRHNVEIVDRIFATSSVPEYERKDYIVIERLPSDVDVKQTDCLSDWLIATANANAVELLNWGS